MNKWKLLIAVLLTVSIAGTYCTPVPPEGTPVSRDTTRPPTRTIAGMFAPAAAPSMCVWFEIESEHRNVDGSVIDADDNGTEAVQLTATLEPLECPEGGELIWLDGETVLAVGEMLTVDAPLGTSRYTVGVRGPEGDVPLRTLTITVIGPRTPTARFSITEDSFLTGCADYWDDVMRTNNPLGGTATVRLDGTKSSGGLLSSIAQYTWGVDGFVAATGPMADVPLGVGTHAIQLLIENIDGESHLLERAGITIESGTCP